MKLLIQNDLEKILSFYGATENIRWCNDIYNST